MIYDSYNGMIRGALSPNNLNIKLQIRFLPESNSVMYRRQ